MGNPQGFCQEKVLFVVNFVKIFFLGVKLQNKDGVKFLMNAHCNKPVGR